MPFSRPIMAYMLCTSVLQIITLFLPLEASATDLDTWTDKSEKYQLKAAFVKIVDNVVHLQPVKGTRKKIQLKNLNLESQQLARKLQERTNPKTIGQPEDIKALNALARGKTLPGENAVVALWEAYGIDKLQKNIRNKYLRELGVPSNIQSEASFLTWQDYFQQQGSRAELGGGYNPREANDHAALSRWIKKNQRSFELVLDAVKKTHYFSPMVNEPKNREVITSFLPIADPARDLIQALAIRSSEQLKEGQLDDAWESTLACYRLSRLISHEPTLIGFYIGQAGERYACNSIVELSSSPKFNRETFNQCMSDLATLLPLPSTASKLANGEKGAALDALYRILDGGPSQLNFTLQFMRSAQQSEHVARLALPQLPTSWNDDSQEVWKLTIPLVIQYYDRWAKILDTKDSDKRNRELELELQRLFSDSEINRMSKLFLGISSLEKASKGAISIIHKGEMPKNITSQDIATFLISVMFPDVKYALKSEVSIRVRSGVIPVVLALGAYRNEQDSYPASLNELVPNYLQEIPTDIMHSSPLVYRREGEGYILYSLGPDGLDDRGQEDLNAERYDLAVVKVP